MLKIYNHNEDSLNTLTKEDNPNNLTKEEAKAILEEIGYDFYSYENSPFGRDFIFEKNVSLTPQRFGELLNLAGIENPYEDIKPIEDAFSFK
ncbi:hypothetical protein ACNO6Z_11680, partial [Aliarcobacter lanthieri]